MSSDRSPKQTAKEISRKQATQLAPTRGPQPAGLNSVVLQRAIAEPLSALPTTIQTLQRTHGNRFVQRLFESALQRNSPVGLEGGAVNSDLQAQIERAQGGGQSLERRVGSQMGSALGADFSGVRVHTDSQSDSLNRSLSARAFTLGSDVFFSRGAYNPGSSSGKELLAHELAHVVQQGGGRSNKAQTKLRVGPVGDRYEQEADRVAAQVRRATETSPASSERREEEPGIGKRSGSIQRAMSWQPIHVSSTGRASVIQGSWLSDAGQALKSFAKKVTNPFRTAFGRANKVKDEETGVSTIDEKSPEDREQYAAKTVGSVEGATPDYVDGSLADQRPDQYRVTLAVAQEDISWYRNMKALKKKALQKLVTSPKKLLAGMQGYLAQKVLSDRGELEGKSEEEQQQLVEQFTGGIHDVGHAWVRLSTYVGGQLKELYSYGMWPQKIFDPASGDMMGGYAGFVKPGPGQIRHPDTAHEGDASKAYLDFDVSAENYNKALQKAAKRYNSPPPYVLTGYNCTAFAREIVLAAGAPFPGKGLILPGFAYTPGNLYWAIMKEWAKGNKQARTNDKHSDIIKQVGEETKQRAESEQEQARIDYALKEYGQPKEGADEEGVTLEAGNTIQFGEKPHPRDKTLTIENDMGVTAVMDDEFIDLWKAVPVKFGSFFWYVDADDFKDAMVEDQEELNEEKTEEDGLEVYGYRGTTPPANGTDPDITLPASKAPFLSIDTNETGGWSSIIDMSEGTYYWVRTSEFNSFTNPGAKDQPDALEEEASIGPEERDEDVSIDQRSTASVDLDDLLDELTSSISPTAPQEEQVDQEDIGKAYSAALEAFREFEGFDISTLLTARSDLETALRIALTGDGREERAEQLAKALDTISAEELIKYYGPTH